MKSTDTPPRVAIFFTTSCKAGRDRIAGALDFIARFTDWDCRLVQRENRTDRQIREDFLRLRPQGVILQCGLPADVYPSARLNAPVVTIDGYSWKWDFRPTVRLRLDEEAIGRAAAQFFRRRGFAHAAYVGSMTRNEVFRSHKRGQAFASAFGVGATPLFQGRRRLADFLTTLPKPCGIFTYSDQEADTVIRLCGRLDLHVPDQLAVLGVDNTENTCEECPVKISSIQPDFRKCGYVSAEALYRKLYRQAGKTPTVFGVDMIVERASTSSVGAAHRITGKALRLIDEGYAHAMDMNRLAEQAGVSLRTLERFFRGTTGHSIRAEIRERRLQKAATLLRETKADLAKVAAESGLGTAANLCALFKRRFHQTPADSRQNRPAT